MKKLIPKSHFTNKGTSVDSVKERIRLSGTEKTNRPLLDRCRQAWENLADFRKKRLRNFQYVFGDQWGDVVSDGHGRYITERERISRKTGGVALQNNHLIKIVNSLTGVYVKAATKPTCFARQRNADRKSQMMTEALQTNWDNNLMKDLLASEMIEFICGGCAVVSEEWSTHDSIEDSYTYPVNPSYFFYESKANDPRHWDDSLIGEIRDYTLGELASVLANSEYDYRQLEEIYGPWLNANNLNYSQQTDHYKWENFETPPTPNLCRTYHVWTLENKPRYRCVDIMDNENPVYRIELNELSIVKKENENRLKMGLSQGMAKDDIPLIEYKYIIDQFWHFQMLDPLGRVLVEYDTPYEYKSHPYVYKLHYLVNGNIIPFISVIIDQQRYINRLIMLNDMMIQASAKGIKMIPKSCVPKSMSNAEFAQEFVDIGGFIFYDPDPTGAKPEVITTNSTNVGIAELLQLQLNFINDISSVSEALQGKTPASGTAASRYAMEMQNSTTAIASLITKFSTFENDVARKKMKTIHQYYQQPRNISVEHSFGYSEYDEYEPQEVADIDFSVSIKESADTPVARMMVNDLIKEMWQAGQISAEQMLTYSYYPGGDELLQALKSAREASEQGGHLQPVSQQQMQPVTDKANPAIVQQVQQVLQQ
jgi:polyhydroxyalkanoate synthesis regulator phasin